MCSKCSGIKPEYRKTDFYQVLTSSAQNLTSFHVGERTRTAMKCTKMEKACVRAKRGKLQFAIVKYANLSSLVPCFRSFQFRETYIAQLISNGTSYRQKCLLTKLFFDSLNNHLSNGMLTRDGVNIWRNINKRITLTSYGISGVGVKWVTDLHSPFKTAHRKIKMLILRVIPRNNSISENCAS